MPRPLKPPRLERDGGTGIWRVEWWDKQAQRTRRYSLDTTDQAAAERRFAEFLIHKLDGDAARGAGPLTVGAALTHYWNEHATATTRDGRPKVIDHERIDVAIRNLELHFVGMPVAHITADEIKRYSQRRAAGEIGFAQGGQSRPKPVKDGTIRRELQCLVAALYWATRKGRLSGFDFTQIDVGEPPEPRHRVLTVEEWSSLIFEAAGRHDQRLTRLYRFLMIGLHAPARRRAIERLMWTQVDLKVGIIDFNPRGEHQSNKRKPKVRIADVLRPVLERAFREKAGLYVLDHPGAIKTAYYNAVRRAGLAGTGVNIHTLRHTHATWSLEAGTPPWEVAGMLGDSVQTVIRSYGHHRPEFQRGAANFGAVRG
jgi:integrase